MHHSEPCPEAITGRRGRKHNSGPASLPPCPDDTDLLIEAEDKEQAVFEPMRTFKLPGWDTLNNIIPYERPDDNKSLPKMAKMEKTKKQIAAEIEEFGKELSEEEEVVKEEIPEEEIGMGGKENRVYWPVGMEEWLRPKKREIKKGGENEEEMFKNPTLAYFEVREKIMARNKEPFSGEVRGELREAGVWLMFRRYWRRSRLSEDDEDEELCIPDLSDEDGKLQGSIAAVKANPTRRSHRASATKVSLLRQMAS
jgi:UV DNA damage endonuclease